MKLKQIAAERGQSTDEMMADVISKECNAVRIAANLGVAPNTVRHYLLANGYKLIEERRFRWVKDMPIEAGQP